MNAIIQCQQLAKRFGSKTVLQQLSFELQQGDVVIGASLLKQSYRELINKAVRRIRFAQLDAPKAVLKERLDDRKRHFFRKSLLDSQLAIYDPLGPNEPGRRFDATKPVDVLVSEILLDIKTN